MSDSKHISQKQVSIQKEFWEEILEKGISNSEQLGKICKIGIDRQQIDAVVKEFPMFINPYYLSLVRRNNDAVWKQCIPNILEVEDDFGFNDPLHEDDKKFSPVTGLTHRYPDRVLMLVSNKCAMYCRFCTRKRKVGKHYVAMSREQLANGIGYIKEHPEIRDVILSGGDPMLLKDDEIEWILKNLREIKHVEIIRIGTRVPCTLPQRITPELCAMLKKYHPLYINTHFNHPNEITEASKKACEMLADAGIPLGNQTVLLKGVNDDTKIMSKLMKKLLAIRVKPYYIYQTDLTRGTNHFRTKVSKGIEIIKGLRGHISGMAVPHYVIDLPGGGGKTPILPQYMQDYNEKTGKIALKNYKDELYEYIDGC
ncbi:MAG: KamA family radical SAM protein [archaeon]